MYEKIEVIIFQKRMSKRAIAEALKMTYNTFLLKMRGKSQFTLDEAIFLKSILGADESVEELFTFSAA